jgi:polysaccharide export outer membrane protein
MALLRLNQKTFMNTHPPQSLSNKYSLLLRRLVRGTIVAVGAFAYGSMTVIADAPLGDYRIAPRDLVRFQIYEEPDTRIVQRVSTSGELPLPMIGVVKVAGLTLREAERKLGSLYVEQEFFVKPQVILVLEQYAERSVSVLGQVNKPEQILFPLEADTLSIVQAITLAGGLTRLARADSVQVTRMGQGGVEQRMTINVDAYLADRRRDADTEDYYLLPGDIVFVPERSF